MQQVLQDPSHTGAALQLYEQLKNCFPNVSSNFIVAVVTEHGANPQYCFDKIREESRSSTGPPPESYYPWTTIGTGSFVRRQNPRAPMSPVAQRPNTPVPLSPLTLHFPSSNMRGVGGHSNPSPQQIRYVVSDGVRSQLPSHLMGPRLNHPQRSASMTFDGTTPSPSYSTPIRPPSSPQPPSFRPQVSYPGSPVGGRQSPFNVFYIGAGGQRPRLLASPMLESSLHSTSMTNLASDAERTRRPSYPLLTPTSSSSGQKHFILNLPSHYRNPLQVMTTSDEGQSVDSLDRTTSTPPAVTEKKNFTPPIGLHRDSGFYGYQQSATIQQKQQASIQIKFGGNTMVIGSSSSGGDATPTAGRSTLTFGIPKVTFGPRAVYVSQNTPRSAEYIKTLLENQLARREELRGAMEFSKTRLNELINDVDNLEINLNVRRKRSVSSMSTNSNVSSLHQETRKLQAEVNVFMKQIDSLRKGEGPSNLVQQCNFHEHMGSTGPVGKVAPVARKSSFLPKFSLDKSEKYRTKSLKNFGKSDSLDSTEGEHWKCEACTFENHPALNDCEVCEFPRSKMKGTASWSAFPTAEIGGTFKCYCCPSPNLRVFDDLDFVYI